MRSNTIATLTIAGASQGQIHDNAIAGAADGLVIDAAFGGLIFNNDISASSVAVTYAASAALSGNRIHGAQIGVATSVSDRATLFGAVAGSTPNTITGNSIGVQLANAQVINQTITANAIGVSGGGIIGGTSAALYNVISYNITGVANFTGLIQFNRIDDNATGIAATTGLNIFNNQLVANTQYAILVSGVARVQIAGNTLHSYVGDAIHLMNGATNIAIVSNIIWTDTGTGIYVANDSQTGFWSDYNDLFATGAGTIVWWTRYFSDILDWRADVALYDLHSIGVTSVNPEWAQPQFGVDQYGFLVTRPAVAGLQVTDPTMDAGDPAGSFYGYNGAANLLADAGFANGLTGWTFTPGGSTTTSALPVWDSAAEYQSGSNNTAVLQQTVSLLQQGVTASEIDAGSVQIAFGGQVSILSSAVSAEISLIFLDGSNNQLGQAVVVQAGTTLGSWMRTFDTVTAPTGARAVEYKFSVTKTDSSQGALLDNAFLAVVPQGVGQDLGVRPDSNSALGLATPARIDLTSPQYYLNWVANAPMFITWDAFGSAAGQPVSIELWQDTATGPQLISTIAASTPDTGLYAWSPSLAGITAGTTGLRIRIASVANPAVYQVSQEAFTVPAVGSQFYVAANGSNRNTGTTASAPLPYPNNVFRDYAIGAGDVVNIAAGDYPLLAPLTLSGATNMGLGIESGFTLQGSTNGTVNLHQANPLITPQAIILIDNASYVTINNLTLTGGVEGLVVDDGSNTFNASYLTATGQSQAGFYIDTNSPSGTLDHLTATNNGVYGLEIVGTIGAITNMTQSGDQFGIYAYYVNNTPASIGRIDDSSFSNDSAYGAYLYVSAGSTTITGSTFSGDATGVYLGGGANITFGDANLADGKGNIVEGTTANQGLNANGALVYGNVFENNSGRADAADINGGAFSYNLVLGNSSGVGINYSGAQVIGNRIYDNGNFGLQVNAGNVTVSQNTIYSNPFGIITYGAGNTFSNNLVYADTYAGLFFANAANNTVINNTIYEPTAGSLPYAANPNWDVGAIVLDSNSTGAKLQNNIITALSASPSSSPTPRRRVSVPTTTCSRAARTARPAAGSARCKPRSRSGARRPVRTRIRFPAIPISSIPPAARPRPATFRPSQTGVADDFHLQSAQGSDHGGSLSVIAGNNGLPVLPTGAYAKDASTSPGIAAGNPATPIGAEPSPNGGIVEIGAYGGTSESSLTPSSFIAVTAPGAGANVVQGNTLAIAWNAFNVSGTVDISIVSGGTTTVLASGVLDSGGYSWTMDGAVFAVGAAYQVQVASSANPAISGESRVSASSRRSMSITSTPRRQAANTRPPAAAMPTTACRRRRPWPRSPNCSPPTRQARRHRLCRRRNL